VFMNTRGTKYMLELAQTLKHLDFFAYCSTAYCHLHVKTLYEKPYDALMQLAGESKSKAKYIN